MKQLLLMRVNISAKENTLVNAFFSKNETNKSCIVLDTFKINKTMRSCLTQLFKNNTYIHVHFLSIFFSTSSSKHCIVFVRHVY